MKRVTRRYGGGRVVEAVRVLVQVAHLLRREELGGEVALGHVERHCTSKISFLDNFSFLLTFSSR